MAGLGAFWLGMTLKKGIISTTVQRNPAAARYDLVQIRMPLSGSDSLVSVCFSVTTTAGRINCQSVTAADLECCNPVQFLR